MTFPPAHKTQSDNHSTKSECCSNAADAYLRSYFIGDIDLAEGYTREAQEHFNVLWDTLMKQIENATTFDLCCIVSPEDSIFGIGWHDSFGTAKVYIFESEPWMEQ